MTICLETKEAIQRVKLAPYIKAQEQEDEHPTHICTGEPALVLCPCEDCVLDKCEGCKWLRK